MAGRLHQPRDEGALGLRVDQVNKLLRTHRKGKWGLEETLRDHTLQGAPGERGSLTKLAQGPCHPHGGSAQGLDSNVSYIPTYLISTSHIQAQKTALAPSRASRALSGELPGKSKAAGGQGTSHLSWGLQGAAALSWRSTRTNCDQGQNPHPRGDPAHSKPGPCFNSSICAQAVEQPPALCGAPCRATTSPHTLQEPGPHDGKGWSLCATQ